MNGRQTVNGKVPFPAQSYRYRRDFFVRRLDRISSILCPGDMGRTLIEQGVAGERIRPLLTSAVDIESIAPKPLRENGLPVTFGFFGGSDWRKGVHLLLDAFRALERDKTRLLIYGKVSTPLPRYSGIEIRGWYDRLRFNEVLAEIDVGVVPSLSDPCPAIISEFLKARIPVVGSEVDGIPELLKHGEYGLLCRPDAGDLAAKMTRFIERPSLVRDLQERINPPTTMKEYAGEIGQIYKQLLGSTSIAMRGH
jgi:glycosyltransferase involved in cell wall biosynthesis